MTSQDVSPGAMSDEGNMEHKANNPESQQRQATPSWKRWFGGKSDESQSSEQDDSYRPKLTLGILSDKQTDEVPGKSAH